MTGREKFILTLMALVMVVGGWFLFYKGKPASSPKISNQSGSTLALTMDILEKLKQKTSLKEDMGVIRSATSKWARDPFLDNTVFLTKNQIVNKDVPAIEKKHINIVDLSYTGYIQMGNRALAIINGLEYEKGDLVDKSGRYLKQIHPTQIQVGEVGSDGVIIIKLDEPFTR